MINKLLKGKQALGKVVSFSKNADVLLRKSDIYELDRPTERIKIRCLEGVLWITQKGDVQDYLLRKGQVFRALNPQGVLVQGFPLGRASISIS